jgi:hypothetical protein
MQPEVQPNKSQIQSFEQLISSRFESYQIVARDAGFGLRYGDKTCFDHIPKEIVIGVAQLLEKGINSIEEFDFAVLHEIKHYKDLRDSPEAYLQMIKEGSREDGLGKLCFGLFNCTEDVGVNWRVKHDSSVYREGSDYAGFLKETYRKKLFPTRDFTEQLLCEQFSNYILNLGMGVADDIILSPEVKAVIDQKLDCYFVERTYQEFIDKFLKPIADLRNTPANSFEERYKAVKEILLPIFEQLLQADITKHGIQYVKAKAEGATPFGSPVGGNIEDFKEAVGKVIEDKANKNKTGKTRNQENRDKQIADQAEKAGKTPKEAKDFANRLNKLQTTINELAGLWLKVPQKNVETFHQREGFFRTGVIPNPLQIAKKFIDIKYNPDTVEVMEKQMPKEIVTFNPKHFRLRLVVDTSGSMSSYVRLVSDLALAITASFIRVNTEAEIRGIDFRTELQVVGFNDSATELLKTTKDLKLSHIMRVDGDIQANGGTSDHKAYELVLNGLDKKEEKARKNGELVDLMLVITDGDTSNPNLSYKYLKLLEDRGLVARGIRIGAGSQFDEVWNKNSVRGVQIKDVRKLHNVVYELIREPLKIDKIEV